MEKGGVCCINGHALSPPYWNTRGKPGVATVAGCGCVSPCCDDAVAGMDCLPARTTGGACVMTLAGCGCFSSCFGGAVADTDFLGAIGTSSLGGLDGVAKARLAPSEILLTLRRLRIFPMPSVFLGNGIVCSSWRYTGLFRGRSSAGRSRFRLFGTGAGSGMPLESIFTFCRCSLRLYLYGTVIYLYEISIAMSFLSDVYYRK